MGPLRPWLLQAIQVAGVFGVQFIDWVELSVCFPFALVNLPLRLSLDPEIPQNLNACSDCRSTMRDPQLAICRVVEQTIDNFRQS